MKTEETKIICTCCSCVCDDDNIVWVGDSPLCTDCADTEIFVCDDCGERFWNSSDHGDGELHLCAECRERHYVTCEHCGGLIAASDAYYAEDDESEETPYCRECYERQVSRAIHNYCYKPEPIFYGDGPFYLGVELEVDEGGKYGENAAKVLAIMNASKELAYMKSDGSLNDGMELVSHPCTLEYHLHRVPWQEAMQKFSAMGYYSHSAGTCGLHVHVSRSALGEDTYEQEESIGKILYVFERFWQEILRFSRRTEGQMNRWAARYGYKNSGQEILKTAKEASSGRYSCINLTNAATIEFRAFRGTLKYNTFAATLQFVSNLCKVAVSMSEDDLKTLCWPALVQLLTGAGEPELIQYLKERRLYVNEPVSAEQEV